MKSLKILPTLIFATLSMSCNSEKSKSGTSNKPVDRKEIKTDT